ncbi:hypothetical protein GCM10020256_48700 [Streptomyces thermocoprophilus]
MITQPDHVPERLALLPASAADPFITEQLLKAEQVHGGVDLAKVVVPLPEDDARWDVEPIRSLVEDAMFEFRDDRTRADAWLAPRLHATLRLTRRKRRTGACGRTSRWRWPPTMWRGDTFLRRPRRTAPGASPRSASRGRPTDSASHGCGGPPSCSGTGRTTSPSRWPAATRDLIHTVLRRDLIDHRPTAQALVRLVRNGKVTTGREINGLSVAITAAGATLVYDVLAPDEPRDLTPLRDWIAEAQTAPPVSRHVLPEGPDEDPVPEASVDALTDYFLELFETAPVRGTKIDS